MSLDQLRVALLSPCYWPEVRRGTERFTRDLADGLIARGHRPYLITSHPGRPRRTIESGLPVLRLPRPPQGRLLRRHYLPYLTHVPLSYGAVRAGDYDVVQAMYPADALAAARWGRATDRPAVFSYMGIPDRAGVREFRRGREVMLAALSGCDATVALSQHAAQAFSYWLGHEARVIPPGVDLEGFHPGPERASEPTIICSAAADEPRKNVGLLVHAFSLVRRARPDARLVLSRPRSLEAARRAGVEIDAEGVEWADLDRRDVLARAYAQAWVAALPSRSEAFGLVLVEALACGTPAVGYARGGMAEIIDRPAVGRVFDELEPAALARALLEAMEMTAGPQTAAACRERAQDFSVDRCTESYVALYRGARGRAMIKPAASRRDLVYLAFAIALGLAVRVTYVVLTRHYRLAGDAVEYDVEGQLIAQGHLFWTAAPYGILHAGAWKAPGYPAWVGLWYAIFGHHPLAVRLLQVPLGALTIALSWLLARRLFGPRVATVAAFVVALYPLAWQYEELLYSEALATPVTLVALLLIFTRSPSRRTAAVAGLVIGVVMLIRPSAEFLFLGALVAWGVTAGWRSAIGLTALSVLVAVLVIAPWTVRNAIVLHGFVPISLQDAALYGTFNATSAHDPLFPYAWRREPPSAAALFDPHHPLPDVTLRAKLIHLGESYISAHPESVPAAFFWNGLSRLWDIRRRSRALAEAPFEGRSRLVTNLGLDAYFLLLPLAVLGLWRARRRRSLVLGVLAIALGASIVFTVDAGTRYRATLEPLIAILACAGVLGARAPRLDAREG